MMHTYRQTQHPAQSMRPRSAVTVPEMLVAMAIMAVVFAVILPQFYHIRTSWDAREGAAEALQNGRVLTEHLSRNLAKAVRITAVSDSAETDGYIEFEDNDASTLRYAIAANNYVEFGPVGNLADLAGPVSSLQFTCYRLDDFDTPVTDGNDIRLLRVETTLTNSASQGQDKTLSAYVHIRVNAEAGPITDGLVGWWKLDEASGLTAADSSGSNNDGTLNNMAGTEWTTGQNDGALEFYGSNDYVAVSNSASLQLTSALTIAGWIKADSWDSGTDVDIIARKGEGSPNNYQLSVADGRATLYLDDSDGNGFRGDTALNTGQWYHIAGTWDGTTVRIYLNGVLDNDPPDSRTGTIGTDTRPVYIGGRSGTDLLDGILDDIRIYNRALGSDEIAQLAGTTGSVTYGGFTEAKSSSGVTSITVSTPGSTAEGDLLIAAVATDGSTESSLAPPGGEGWTEIDIGDGSNNVTLGVWWKLAEASESSTHQFTWSGSKETYAWMMRFTGHDPDDPINATAALGSGNDSTPPSPAVSTTVDEALILRLGAFDDDDISVNNPGLSGHTAVTMDASGSGSGTCSGGAGYVQQSTAGDSGTSSFSLTNSEQSRTVTIGIAPDPSAGGGSGEIRP